MIRLAALPRSRYRPLVALLAATSLGIVLDGRFAWSWNGQFLASIVGWSLWLCTQRSRPRFASASLLVASAAVGGAWHHACWNLYDVDDLATFATVDPRAVYIEATVVDAPRVVIHPSEFDATKQEIKTRFTIDVLSIRDGGSWRRAAGLVDVQIDARVESVTAGDRVRLIGRVARSPPLLNPGEFDFAAHYRAERKLCLLRSGRVDSVTVVAPGSPWNISARLSQWRRRGHARLVEYVPSAQAGFASALLLGYRDELQRHENRAFFRSGTIHILSISGLHIGMLALFLHAALRIGWLRRGAALAVVMLITVCYALVIDAEPPAVRAVLTVLLIAGAALMLRRTLDGNVLAAAALAVLAQNPTDLFRAGPQLSFLAAVVLTQRWRRPPRYDDDQLAILFRTRGTRVRHYTREFFVGLGDMLVMSSLIFVAATPLVARQFHIVSPIALVLTPIVALPTALALFSGFLTLTVGAVLPPLAPVFGFLCGMGLDLTERIVEWAQRVPYGWFRLPGPGVAALAVFYLLGTCWCLSPRRSLARFAFGAVAVVWSIGSLVPVHTMPPDVEVRTTFISVGHGLSVLVEERDGPVWLYDCGRFGAAERGAQSIAGVLWSRGITRLDAIVVSHTDADHYNALPFLIEEFRVARIFVSTVTFVSSSQATMSIRQTADRAGVPIVPLPLGDELFASSTAVQRKVLLPPPLGVVGNDNANSIVIELNVRGRRLLLTGDLEGEGLARLLARPASPCEVILAPHHGSARSNPPGLAAWSKPQWVIVSGDEDRRGLVRKAFEAVGATLLETTSDGAVTVDVDRDGQLRVTTFRKENEATQR